MSRATLGPRAERQMVVSRNDSAHAAIFSTSSPEFYTISKHHSCPTDVHRHGSLAAASHWVGARSVGEDAPCFAWLCHGHETSSQCSVCATPSSSPLLKPLRGLLSRIFDIPRDAPPLGRGHGVKAPLMCCRSALANTTHMLTKRTSRSECRRASAAPDCSGTSMAASA